MYAYVVKNTKIFTKLNKKSYIPPLTFIDNFLFLKSLFQYLKDDNSTPYETKMAAKYSKN